MTFTLGTSSVELVGGAPQRYELKQNYPNQLNPTTNIEFSMLKSGYASLKVYDVIGREVSTIVDEDKSVGNYRATFSSIGGSTSGGDARNLPSGTYFYTLRSGEFSQTKKLLILK